MARICMIAYTFYTTDPRVRREAEALVARGDSVDFICLNEPGDFLRRENNGVRLHPISTARYQGQSTLAYMGGYLSFFVQASILVSVLFAKNRYDVIQVHTMTDFMEFSAFVPIWLCVKGIFD